MYEVLDVLSMYVFGRKTEHKNEVHMIPFDPNDECFKQESDQQEAVQKMQQVSLILHFIFGLLIKIFLCSYPTTCLKI